MNQCTGAAGTRLALVVLLALLLQPLAAQEVPFTHGPPAWNADSLGNHRAVVKVSRHSMAVKVHIPWRRHDQHPEQKRVIVQDAQTGQRIRNVQVLQLNREAGDLLFQPTSGPGRYYVYYLPYKNEGRSNYPRGVYLQPDTTASADWLQRQSLTVNDTAQVLAIQSIDAFNGFYPMEVIATRAETQQLLARHPGAAYLVFPEDRLHPIRLQQDLPYRWVRSGPAALFQAQANKGEQYAFQLGLYALQPLQRVSIRFSSLVGAGGAIIDWTTLQCLQTGGIQYDGQSFTRQLDVAAQTVQPFWCLVAVPLRAAAGIYHGTVTVQSEGQQATTIRLQLTVTSRTAENQGTDQPKNMTHLAWLNSTLAQQNTVVAPYTPLRLRNDTIRLLGRAFTIGQNGLPAQIRTYFTPEMTAIGDTAYDLLTEPVHFHETDTAGKDFLHWKTAGYHLTRREAGTIAWQATSTSEALQMDVSASVEFDGFVAYRVQFIALSDIALSDIKLHLPLQPAAARYCMGLGLKGGERPDTLRWKWDVAHKNQDGAWIGNVNAGLQFSLRDERYVRPLNTNFYLQQPLRLPASWGNGQKGGIDVYPKGKAILVNAYSGSRTLQKGDTLYYYFNLLVTPFHPLQTDFQWSNRFYHRYNAVDSIAATGATVVNIHHATPVNPWINYPFIEWRKLKAYTNAAHQKGLKVKIYYTIRELSNHAYEWPVLKSLGSEMYAPGKGGGFAWLQEHMSDNYLPAWFVPEIKDAAVINSGANRWHNYYIEGMNWLVQHTGIDGIYLDDVAFDRITMKRLKRVLTRQGHPGIIDLHSANQYNRNDGFNNSANLYLEHFPYLNRLWFGEYFDYAQASPSFLLTEVSGIPFGLMGEMLQDGGNPWRGMIYGMTNRLGWTTVNDPRPLWACWQQFGLAGSEMMGYWSGRCPVQTDNGQVLATVYRRKGRALIALASWAATDTTVRLQVNWRALGIDASHAKISAPPIAGFQPAQSFAIGQPIPVVKGRGWLLLIE